MAHEPFVLRPFQETGASFLLERRFAYLGDRMGLGKTPQIAVAAFRLKERLRQKAAREGWRSAWRCLVICPAIAIPQWQTAMARAGVPHVEVVSFNQADKVDAGTVWSLIVVDEAHYLQGLDTQRSRVVLGTEGLIHRCDYMWFASGTPAPRGDPRQVWPIMYVTGTTPLTFEEWTEAFCEMKVKRKRYGDKVYGRIIETIDCVGIKNAERLRAVLKPFLLRRHENDVMPDMPPLMIEPVPIAVPDLDEEFFQRWFPSYAAGHLDRKKGDDAFTALIRLGEDLLRNALAAEAAGNATEAAALMEKHEVRSVLQLNGLRKVKPLLELFKAELDAGAYEKLGIICKHKSVMREFHEGLADYGAEIIWGDQPPKKRHAAVSAFRNYPSKKVIVLQIDTAGTALDGLQVCNQAAMVEKSWIPGVNDQAWKRFHRFDTKSTVFGRDFYAVGTSDEQVNKVLARRSGQHDQMFGSPAPAGLDDFWEI